MTEDRIEYVDRDYAQCAYVNPSRQIKTKKESFGKFVDKFTQFRIRLLERKLDKKVEKALTEGYGNNYEKKIAKNAEVIARLEEKIMILSREDVPSDYVARRAIKLRKSMIDNLTYNTTSFYGNLYSVGLENKDKVLGSGIEPQEEDVVQIQEAPIVDKEEAIPYQERVMPYKERAIPYKERVIPYKERVLPYEDKVYASAAIPAGTVGVEETLGREDIKEAINDVFEDDKSSTISNGDVREVVDGKLAEISEDTPVIDKEVVRKAVDDAFRKLEEDQQVMPQTTQVQPQTTQVQPQPTQVQPQPTVEEKVDQEIEKIRVSRNNVGTVRPELYDENGQRIPRRKKYDYKPMTDEEIRASQIKLGFDEHGNLIDNGKREQPDVVSTASVVGEIHAPSLEDVFVPSDAQVVRDVPVVVKDRDAAKLDFDLDEGKSMFEIVNHDDAKEEVHTESSTMTIDDYTALREKILLLQKQKAESQQQRLEAQRREEEAQARAQEARRMYEVSQANYNDRMRRLRDYAATLEAACSENERQIAASEQRLHENDEFVESQRQQASRTNQIISEIDSMMNDSSETPAIAVRSVK